MITRPCPECPFRRTDGAVRLYRRRIRQICGNMLSFAGGQFPCHKTTAAGGADPPRNLDCAGASIFALKNGIETQWMRIAMRLGYLDPDKLEGHDEVFDNQNEMLATALDPPRRRTP